MIDFDVASPSRRCAATEREFAPGEAIVSYLVREGTEIVRKDVSPEVWAGPPEGCVAWWRSQIPHPASKKVSWSPDEEALEWFASLVLPEQAAERYVLALALTRKRLLRLVRTENDAAGAETMVFISAVDDSEHAVTVVEPSAEEIEAIQRILAERLRLSASRGEANQPVAEEAATDERPNAQAGAS
jgi:hypothetical protein